MNWRWRAVAQKIDPAMLASTVTEYLLPKIEIGLLYAYGLSEEMCQGWTRTIIHTLANTAGMNKTLGRTMSSQAFCLLGGIPDVGLRMQTLRITEFFLLINSNNCISGKTTLARLCALKHKPPAQIKEILEVLFQNETKINHRKQNRLADTIKWMKKRKLHITEKGEDKSDIMKKINDLSQFLHTHSKPSQHLIAYTDGSTETKKGNSKNSGYGIHITTNSHTPIFSGGGIVRSDGNNFIAEMAAASVVIGALPLNRKMTMYIDSTATIQALAEGPVSERKRIKMQGRAWKSFLKTTSAIKHRQIHTIHVKSHEDTKSPEQRGNDHADKMAKKFMSQSQSAQPLPYFTKEEEKFLAFHQDTLIVGNIRMWLKEEEIKQLQDNTQSSGQTFSSVSSADPGSNQIDKKLVNRKNGGKSMDFLYLCCV